jgi:hypothetical protein
VKDAVAHGATDLGRAGGACLLEAQGWLCRARYRATVTPRPPRPSTFRLAQEQAGGARAVLFGPLVHMLPGAAGETAWLAGLSGVRAVDEGAMIQALRRAAAGTL